MSLKPRLTTFANNPLDRAGHDRTDAGWIEEKLNSPDALIMLLWNGMPLVLPEAQAGPAAMSPGFPAPRSQPFEPAASHTCFSGHQHSRRTAVLHRHQRHPGPGPTPRWRL